MSREIKTNLITACEAFVLERIARLEAAIADLEEALKLETKCSMGDKYETGRAMLHLEFEKLSAQYEEYSKLRKTLRLIDASRSHGEVGFGSVVYTQKANYFLSIPAGELQLEREKFYAVGKNAPIAQALKGLKEGDEVVFNHNSMKILKVL